MLVYNDDSTNPNLKNVQYKNESTLDKISTFIFERREYWKRDYDSILHTNYSQSLSCLDDDSE